MSRAGPASLTVDAVGKYRLGAVKILEHLRPVIEREADLTIGEWAHRRHRAARRCGSPRKDFAFPRSCDRRIGRSGRTRQLCLGAVRLISTWAIEPDIALH
jgi:hypothetical protein